MKRFVASLSATGLLGALLCVSTLAFAGPRGHEHGHGGSVSVPEINGKYAAGALALLVGGAAVIVGRRRRQAVG